MMIFSKIPAEPMILEATYVTYGYIMIYIYIYYIYIYYIYILYIYIYYIYILYNIDIYIYIYIVELRTPAMPVGVGGGKEGGGCHLNMRT